MSIETPYTIWEWERLNKKLKYVALSRAVRKEHMNIKYIYIYIYYLMDLETLYVKFNISASSTFLKLLKNEWIKYNRKNVDGFISHRTEQQKTTIKTEKRKEK